VRKSQFGNDEFNDWEGQHDWHGDPEEDDGQGAAHQPHCNRCYATDVRWRQQGGKWVLFSLEPGKLHVCPIPDEFEAVPE
jgi:hypothetical protein